MAVQQLAASHQMWRAAHPVERLAAILGAVSAVVLALTFVIAVGQGITTQPAAGPSIVVPAPAP